ncbi:hypothetical protein [Novosphingobium kaempferiae]|uniref:hypothetical protein n=1 Tax=Novosphingobium kaempferiae TaxID=2896849 RepID=UPI001E3B41FC|nr:hypothetical protein [Novosphingobium kaempferiae]
MASLEARLIGITIECLMTEAYAFAGRPENFPKWAAGMSSSLHRDGERWLAETPLGEATIRFSTATDFGVLDHRVMRSRSTGRVSNNVLEDAVRCNSYQASGPP